MVKTSPSGGATTRLAGEVQAVAFLMRLTRQDLVVKGLTDHDAPITYTDGIGALTYSPSEGMTGSAISSLFDSQVDELEVSAFIESGEIDYDDLISGRYDAAEIRIYMINWDDIADGAWKMRRGVIGDIVFDEGSVRFQLLGMIQKMHSAVVVELLSSACPYKKFGDHSALNPRCKIQLNASTWLHDTAYTPARLDESAGELAGTEEVVVKPTSFNDRWFVLTTAGTSDSIGNEPSWNTTIGATTTDNTATWTAIRARRIDVTISTITNHMEFVVTGYSGDAPDAFFQSGHVKFTGGNNVNIEIPIRAWDLATLTVTLALPLNLLAVATDALTLVSGCDRLITTCVNTYDNGHNYGGWPYLRGKDSFFTFPDAPAA